MTICVNIMYKEHIAFKPPIDSTIIWRYMNFEKFEIPITQ